MRQLFNKSGMLIIFYCAVFVLCTVLLSLFSNMNSSDIAGSFSDKAVTIEITQDHYSEDALTYSGLAAILSDCKARGAMPFKASGKGYALFNYSADDLSYALMSSEDVKSNTPKAVVSPEKSKYTIRLSDRQTINLFSAEYEVTGTDIYSGANSMISYTVNFAGVAQSTVKFQNVDLIIDCGDNSAFVMNNVKNEIESKCSTASCSVGSLSDSALGNRTGKGSSAISFAIVALTGICLILSSGVFLSAWLDSKKSEMIARKICGADNANIRALIFIYAMIADIVGMAGGFLLTYIISFVPAVRYYLGSIDLTDSLLIAAVLTTVNIIVALKQSSAYTTDSIKLLRRE